MGLGLVVVVSMMMSGGGRLSALLGVVPIVPCPQGKSRGG